MREIHWLLLAFAIFVMGCGKDKEPEPPKPTPPLPPKVEPAPPVKEPGNWPFPFPMPKLPIPGLPSIPGFPGNSPTPSPTPNPAPTPYPGDVYNLGQSVNEARAARGLSPVEILPALNCAAKRHADDVGAKKVCGHTGSDGSSPWDRARDCGTSANGEIVACGQGDAKAAVQAWTYSPGHAAIMYDGGQRTMGVAMYQNYWVVIFQK
jgi:uncharacterized protein YkwD